MEISRNLYVSMFCIFFFKQKTAYEMRISDWSSDVCSSDLALLLTSAFAAREAGPEIARLATLPVYAVGDATARAAEAAGLTVAMTGTADAQPLLDAMASQDIRAILWL